MKLSLRFKIMLYATLLILFVSGLGVWFLNNWLKVDHGMGPEPMPLEIWFLRTHSIIGLWFLIVFGMLLNGHVRRGWRANLKIKSGLALIVPIILLILTVPLLFYVTDDLVKSKVAVFHTYLGFMLSLPFFLHLRIKAT